AELPGLVREVDLEDERVRFLADAALRVDEGEPIALAVRAAAGPGGPRRAPGVGEFLDPGLPATRREVGGVANLVDDLGAIFEDARAAPVRAGLDRVAEHEHRGPVQAVRDIEHGGQGAARLRAILLANPLGRGVPRVEDYQVVGRDG